MKASPVRHLVAAVAVFLLLAVSPLPAAPLNWTNVTAGGLWETPGNWNPNQAPTIADSVTFTVDGSYNVYITNSTADSFASSMTIASLAMGSSPSDSPRLVINYTNAATAFHVTNTGVNSWTMGGGGSRPIMEILAGTVRAEGGFKIGSAAAGSGTVLLRGGSLFTSNSTFQIGAIAGSTGTVIVAGGSLYLTNLSGSTFGIAAAGGNATFGSLVVSNGTVLTDGGSTSIFVVGRAVGGRAELLVSGGNVEIRTGASVGQQSGATGVVLVTGGNIVATNMTGSGSSFFAVGERSAGTMVVSNQGVFLVSQMTMDGAGTGDGRLLVTEGGRMEMTGLNALYAGSATVAGGVWGLSNYNGGTIQFTANNPTLTNRLGTGAGYVINSAIEFKGVNAADLGGNVANFFTYKGTNTLRLIGATNKATSAYSFQTNGTAFAFLDLAGANSAFQATNLTIGAGARVTGTGTLLANNATNLGTLAPGHSAGVLAFSSNLTLLSSSILNIEIGGTNAVDFDRLIANGTLTLGGTLNVILINSFSPSNNVSFDIIDGGLLAGSFATPILPSAAWSFSDTTGILSFTTIPEPGAAALVGLGGLAVLALRRRRSA